jgi:cobalamin biosynthesis protein CobD/CbiB
MTKKILELLVCLLHPIAVVLIWIELLQRDDIGSVRKVAWGIFVLIPLVPFLYVLLGNEFL